MPKKKTKKTVSKRFRKTATGKFKYTKAGASHLQSSKSSKRKRKLRASSIAAKCEQKRIATMVP